MELESKFIEGTNNKYSIRNDGVVINNITNRELKASKNNKVNIRIEDIAKTHTTTNLLKKYFNGVSCQYSDCNVKVTKKYSMYCDTCISKAKQDNQKRFVNKDYDNHAKTQRERAHLSTVNLTKAYVASMLRISVNTLSNEMYHQQIIMVKTKRILSEKLNCSIQALK